LNEQLSRQELGVPAAEHMPEASADDAFGDPLGSDLHVGQLLVAHALQQCADGLQVFRSKLAYPTRGVAGVLVCSQLLSLRLMAQGDPSRRTRQTVGLSALSQSGAAPVAPTTHAGPAPVPAGSG
jgi:hypothetical protein